MTGELGIWQHAIGPVPNEAFGYCIDDVARALLGRPRPRAGPRLGGRQLERMAVAALHADAFDPVSGRFRNFRDADGTWLDAAGSEDSHGRAMLTLGIALRDHPDAEFGANARMLFAAALPAAVPSPCPPRDRVDRCSAAPRHSTASASMRASGMPPTAR